MDNGQSVVVYTSPFERDMYEGLYFLFANYPYHIVGCLVGFILLCVAGWWWQEVGSRSWNKWRRGI